MLSTPPASKTAATPVAGGDDIEATSRTRRRWIGIGVVLLIVALQSLTELLAGHERPRVLLRLAVTAVQMPLLMLALSQSFEWAKRHRMGSIATLLAGAAIAGILGGLFAVAVWELGYVFPALRMKAGPFSPPAVRAAAFGFLFGQFNFGIWALAFVYPFAVEDARVRALEAERLTSAADLARLRAHLEPHFLLNTLNAIAGLVTDEPREARRLLAALGDLLRDATRDGDEMQPVEDEVAWLRRYAAILEARYGGAIVFKWNVDPRASKVLLPRLLLQPLVENAVKHGALARGEGGEVALLVDLDDSAHVLRCTIEDNGPGIPDAPARSGAFGLDAVRRRLSLKDERASLTISSTSRGTRAIVAWPMEVGA
ncbi:two-component sensor histidine kinase [Labilithrix luteola]|uniref:Two-component sensor histidine kinase n=1 Tax=Labilithrix luteola TaxID=1391654 RepID=A0A0K1Q8F7_9BACT|nr:histidine kinase [Labilithrix luteola]AKV01685.1 two-component sensor histidine kinase [Labilithrix luteola]